MTDELRTNQPPLDPRFLKVCAILAEEEGRPFGYVAEAILKTLDDHAASLLVHFQTTDDDEEPMVECGATTGTSDPWWQNVTCSECRKAW